MTSLVTRDAAAATLLHADGFEVRAVNEAARSVDYVCSTATIDGHGTRVAQNWRLDRYAKNPVVLFAHDCDDMPIGLASRVRVERGALMATVTFAAEDVNPKAEECWRAVKAGLLRGISVGFIPHSRRWEMDNDQEVFVLDDNELLELSVTPVPSNPDALAQRAATSAALSTLRASARPSPEIPMNQIEELRAALSARESDLAAARSAEARAAADLTAARAAADKAAAEVQERDGKIALLTTEAERLGRANADLQARAAAAEDALNRFEVEARVGKDVDPTEVDHLCALRKAAPALYDAEMARRAASGRNDQMTARAIPPDAPAQREVAPAVADPLTNFNKALERHMPKGG